MKRRYVDLDAFESRNIVKDGNVDYKYWFSKTNDQRVEAASIMISVAFREPDFLKNKVDRTIFSTRKHSS